MSGDNEELLTVLKDIRTLLSRIYTCFEDQYHEIQDRKMEEQIQTFESLVNTALRRRIYPLFFDSRTLSQRQIATEAGTSQSNISQFATALQDAGLIDRTQDEHGNMRYIDKYDLASRLQN